MTITKIRALTLGIAATTSITGCTWFGQSAPDTAWTVRPAYNVLSSDGFSAPMLYQVGRLFQSQNRYEEAMRAYQDALAKDPGHVDARNGLGVVYSALGRHEEAVAELKAAVAASPESGYLLNNLGFAQVLKGDVEAGVATLELSRQLNPNNDKVEQNLEIAKAILRGAKTEEAAAPITVAQGTPAERRAVEGAPQSAGSQPASPRENPHSDSGAPALIPVAPNVYELRMPKESTPEQKAPPRGPSTRIAGTDGEPPAQGVTNAAGERSVAPSAPSAGPKVEVQLSSLENSRVEVSNGNGINGMARKVSDYLEQHGVPTARLTNDATFTRPATEVQFEPGRMKEAVRLAALMPMSVAAVQTDSLRKDIQVRLVLGRDLSTQVAYFDLQEPRTKVASRASRYFR